MSRRIELLALLVGDTLATAAAAAVVLRGPAAWDWIPEPAGSAAAGVALLVAGWLVLFSFSGLYGERYAGGRLDELVALLKVVVFGTLVLLFGYALDQVEPGALRQAMAVYGGAVFALVGGARLAIRGAQRALVVRGYGRHRAVVVGWSDRVETLYHDLASYPAAGIEVVGAVRLRPAVPAPVLFDGDDAWPEDDGGGVFETLYPGGDALPAGAVEVTAAGAPEAAVAELPRLIDRLGVRDVLIALGSDDHATLDAVLRVCDGRPVTLKLVPDFYAAIGGMARTEHTYGIPLIEVLPEPIPVWERRTKRIVDVVVSAVALVAGLPVWLAVGALVRLSVARRRPSTARSGSAATGARSRCSSSGRWSTAPSARPAPCGRGGATRA